MLIQYNTFQIDSNTLDQIDPMRVEKYLDAHGWSKNAVLSTRLRSVYEINSSKSHKRQVKVLYSRSVSDYNMVLLITISNIAEHEAKPVDEIVRSLIVPPKSDVLKIRAFGGATAGGTISLNSAREMLEGIRRVILSAALGVIKPQAYYPRLGDNKSTELIEKCQLGQTEVGSYVFTVVCPLDAIVDTGELFDQDPFARQVTKNLMVSLERIGSCRTEEDCRKLIADDRLPHHADDGGFIVSVISKNLCDGILDILVNSDSNLEVGIDWAVELESNIPADNAKVCFTQEYVSLLGYMSDSLLPKNRDVGSVYQGTVEKCEGVATDDKEAREGDVVLKFLDDEGELRRARVKLSISEYTQATHAHLKNKKVQIHGTLKRVGRFFRIADHSAFSVI